MKVVQLQIENFRGIQSANLKFDGHALLIGSNNVGKSTICEALDLALGPDRLNRFPPVEEYDFYNGVYLQAAENEGENPVPVKLRVEVLLIELNAEVQKRCGGHLEFWHVAEKRLLTEGEVESATLGCPFPVCAWRQSDSTTLKKTSSLQRPCTRTVHPLRKARRMPFAGRLNGSLGFCICGHCVPALER